MMDKFARLVRTCARSGVTDLHLRAGQPVAVRINTQLRFQREVRFDTEELQEVLTGLTTERQRHSLAERRSLDCSAVVHDAQLRLNVFYTADGLGLAIRFLPAQVPDFAALNLHPLLGDLCRLPHGLLLVCGPTGSGKSTTIAAMIREINETRPCHVVTLEDPIEYRFVSHNALLDQRELGTHFLSFEQGLRDVLREDANVIMVGELREAETMRLTLNAAEAGHLVIATLHAGTPEEALLRLGNAFGEGAQDVARTQIASCLEAIVVQRMELLARAGFRVPVLSVVRAGSAVKNCIRENRLNQLEGLQQSGRNSGMFTFERYREEFLEQKSSLIPPAVAFRPSLGTPPPLQPAEGPAPRAPAQPPPDISRTVGVPQTGPYRIDDEAPLAELVAQMRRGLT